MKYEEELLLLLRSVVVNGMTYRRVGWSINHFLNHFSAAVAPGTVSIRAQLSACSRQVLGKLLLLLLHLLLLPVFG